MTALASSDVTVSAPNREQNIGRGALDKVMSMASITFGDSALTYPTGGVPLPSIGQFGFNRQIDIGIAEPPPGDGYVYKYDRANHTLKIFTMGVVTGSTAATTPGDGALAEDSAAAETAVRLANSAVDTTYDLGPLIELPSGIAPAETTVKLLLIGE